MPEGFNHGWDVTSVLRALKLLGSRPAGVRDPNAISHSVQLVWDILRRRDATPELFQLPGLMPLIVAGTGPVMLLTYLDDAHPDAQGLGAVALGINGDELTGPGITRHAGVVAAIGAFLSPHNTGRFTLVVEPDRQSGSESFRAWLATRDQQFAAALYEVSDLPVPAPCVFRSAAGSLVIEIALRTDGPKVEQLYAGVLPDVSHLLALAIGSLKSRDAEVLLPGFYDAISPPAPEAVDWLQEVSPLVASWIGRGVAPGLASMPASHQALGVFCVPAIVVLSIYVEDARPFLPREARAVVEARLMPGQEPEAVLSEITTHMQKSVPEARVSPLTVQPPAIGWMLASMVVPDGVRELPTDPGNSPAGMLEQHGIPAIGYATVCRDPLTSIERVSAEATYTASAVIAGIADAAQAAVSERGST